MKIKNIVSIHAQKSGEAHIWVRENGELKYIKELYKPFILISKEMMTDNLEYCHVIELAGDLHFKYKIEILNWKYFSKSFLNIYNKKFGANEAFLSNNLDMVKMFNFNEQYLLQSGNRYFDGLDFKDLKRVQFDIETTGLLSDKNAKLFMIAIKSSCGFERVLHGVDELELIKNFEYIIKTIDPDILENHNIFEFDIPFLFKVAKKYNYRLNLSRQSFDKYQYKDTYKYGGITAPFERTVFIGREVIDTLHSARKYDADTGSFKSNCGLKNVAKSLGVPRDSNSYIPGSEIYKTYLDDQEKVTRYALADVREVSLISEKLNASRFYLSKIVPMPYEKICTTGSSKIVELPMVSHYLENNFSLPSPYQGDVIPNCGGLCKVLRKGVIKNVIKLDVKSMYPSIIIANRIGPHSDPLNYFHTNLESLTKRRLEYKEKAKEDLSFDPIQSALKIVINSSYGYLGYKYGIFNNPNGASKVTEIGREIAKRMVVSITKNKGIPVEVDTDGVICELPANVSPNEFNGLVQDDLKVFPYIEIEPEYGDKVIEKIFMYKEKTYAYSSNNELILTGSAFKNRSEPKIYKDFIKKCILHLLNGEKEKILLEYKNVYNQIKNAEVDINDLARTVRIGKSLDTYKQISRKKLPQYEVWINAGVENVKKDTLTSFYKSKCDERFKLSSRFEGDIDTDYYIKSLNQKMMMFEF